MIATENMQYLQGLVEPFGPRKPIGELIEEVNRVYHAIEAREYDGQHPEIMTQLPEIWREMAAHIGSHLEGQPCRVLDFGCGTGFEAAQLLQALRPERIERPLLLRPLARDGRALSWQDPLPGTRDRFHE